MGLTGSKQAKVEEGDCLAFGRLDHVATGDTLRRRQERRPRPPAAAAVPNRRSRPMRSRCSVKDRKDEVRLAAAMAKLIEEDPSLVFVQDQEAGEMKLFGQGEMHLRVALERLAARFGVTVETQKPVRRLSRNHPPHRFGARPPQETIGRPRPVRRRRARRRAPAARRRIRLQRDRAWRLRAEELFQRHRGRLPRRARQGAARLSGGRCRRDPDRRLLSFGRIPPTWPSAPPRASAWPRRSPRPVRCCWSRSMRSK